MLSSRSIPLTLLFRSLFPPISRHLFLQNCFRFLVSTQMDKIFNSSFQSSSAQQPWKPVEDSAVRTDPSFADEQLAATFDENKGLIMFGSIPLLLSGKNVKNYSKPLSRSNHLTSPPTSTTRFEPKLFNRRTRVDIGLVEASGDNCSVPSSNLENSVLTVNKKISRGNFTTPNQESSHGSQLMKKKSTYVHRPYNCPSYSNYAAFGHKIDGSASISKLKSHGNCSLPSSNYENSGLPHARKFSTVNKTYPHDESSQGSQIWKKSAAFVNRPYSSRSNSNFAAVGDRLDASVSSPKCRPYDICFQGKKHPVLTGDTSPGVDKESSIEIQDEWTKGGILRSGMVLLKHYLTHDEQVEIVKVCRELGLGPGGFYQPGYANGAKLRLKMMCLGMDWDPQTYKYGNKRVIDGSKPPSIPNHFSELVKRSIQVAHSLIEKESRVWNVEDELPSMTPDLCIVNFYTNNGKLGLHQDRDESRDSLRKGLPVVSFSIGDSAEFLYGDDRDVREAESVILESGDVLIFGGESRHVFHGVSSVLPNSAPKELLKATGLCPGRLNLTFRQY